MDSTLARTLYKWAKNNPVNQDLLEQWQTAAITQIAAGNGQSVQSTSANGVSVSFQTGGMSVSDWFNTLTLALDFLNSPQSARTKIQGVVR